MPPSRIRAMVKRNGCPAQGFRIFRVAIELSSLEYSFPRAKLD